LLFEGVSYSGTMSTAGITFIFPVTLFMSRPD